MEATARVRGEQGTAVQGKQFSRNHNFKLLEHGENMCCLKARSVYYCVHISDDMRLFFTFLSCLVPNSTQRVQGVQEVWLYVRLGVLYNLLLHKNSGWIVDFKRFAA